MPAQVCSSTLTGAARTDELRDVQHLVAGVERGIGLGNGKDVISRATLSGHRHDELGRGAPYHDAGKESNLLGTLLQCQIV